MDDGDLRISPHGPKLGHRRCPNLECRAHVFVIVEDSNDVIASYPPERIDFDATNLPPEVQAALEEAITCHANACYKAAAMMARKTLEELCDKQEAKGDNLKDRIRNLGTKAVVPKELFDGLDDIRLLGNDAAHVVSKDYEDIGEEEVDIGILFTKEVLKAVYQYSALVAKLKSLKKQPAPADSDI